MSSTISMSVPARNAADPILFSLPFGPLTISAGVVNVPAEDFEVALVSGLLPTDPILRVIAGRLVLGGLPANPDVTPSAGNAQATAQPVSTGITFVHPAANSGDSIALPKAVSGAVVCLICPGSQFMNVYVQDQSGDTVNGITDSIDWTPSGAGGSGPPALWFYCYADGQWLTQGALD